MKEVKLYYSRKEMLDLNTETLKKRGVTLEDIADIAYNQQAKYSDNVKYSMFIIEKALSFLRIVFVPFS